LELFDLGIDYTRRLDRLLYFLAKWVHFCVTSSSHSLHNAAAKSERKREREKSEDNKRKILSQASLRERTRNRRREEEEEEEEKGGEAREDTPVEEGEVEEAETIVTLHVIREEVSAAVTQEAEGGGREKRSPLDGNVTLQLHGGRAAGQCEVKESQLLQGSFHRRGESAGNADSPTRESARASEGGAGEGGGEGGVRMVAEVREPPHLFRGECMSAEAILQNEVTPSHTTAKVIPLPLTHSLSRLSSLHPIPKGVFIDPTAWRRFTEAALNIGRPNASDHQLLRKVDSHGKRDDRIDDEFGAMERIVDAGLDSGGEETSEDIQLFIHGRRRIRIPDKAIEIFMGEGRRVWRTESGGRDRIRNGHCEGLRTIWRHCDFVWIWHCVGTH
jgi:hypothetical protein